MFYLHQILTPRDTIIEITENPVSAPGHLELNGHPLIHEDGGVVQNKAGWTLGPIASDTEAYTLATIIATHYNNDVMADGKLLRLPYVPDSAGVMAAALGRRGGQSTSAAKVEAARENGRKGGRPRTRITRAWLAGWLAEHRPDLGLDEFGDNKGFFQRELGQAASFQACGPTWRDVAAVLEAVESKE